MRVITVVVNTIVDKVATGESSAGVDYITTSSSELSKTGGLVVLDKLLLFQ